MNKVHITEYGVYKEDIDPYTCIIDTGCPKMVTGRMWMDAYVKSRGEKVKIRTGKENENFRFGPSEIYKSEAYYEIEIEMKNLKDKIKVSVVEANIPLLLGLEYQMEWGMVIDLGKQEIYIRKSKDRFKKEKEMNHCMLPIQRKKQRKEEVENLTYMMNLKITQDRQLRQCVKRYTRNRVTNRKNS